MLALLAMRPGAAPAQLLDRDIPLDNPGAKAVGVRDRPRPELEPPTIELGGLSLLPTLDVSLGSSSNVTGASDRRRSDGFIEWQPQLLATLDGGAERMLRLRLDADGKRWFATPAERQDGWFAGAEASTSAGAAGTLYAAASQQRRYEDQIAGSYPADGGGAVAIDQTHLQTRLAQGLARLTVTGALTWDRLRYHQTVTTTGAVLPQEFRDDEVLRAASRLSERIGRDATLFAEFDLRRTSYADTSAYADHASREWRALGGLSWNATGLLRIALALGPYRRDFTRRGEHFAAVDGLDWDVDATYAATPLTTISLQTRREFAEANLAASPGYRASSLRIALDHELLRALLLTLSASAESDRFAAIDRRDRIRTLTFAADGWVSRRWLLRPSIAWLDRRSHGITAGPNFPEWRTQLTLSVRD